MLNETSPDQNSKLSNRYSVIHRHAPGINHHVLNRDKGGSILGQKGDGIGDLQARWQAPDYGR